MGIADSLSTNGELSCLELTSFLRGTKYEDFAEWLTDGMARFTRFDVDGSGSINLNELENAVAEYQMDQEIIGATLHNMGTPPPKVPRRALTAHRRRHQPRRSPDHRARSAADTRSSGGDHDYPGKPVEPVSASQLQDVIAAQQKRLLAETMKSAEQIISAQRDKMAAEEETLPFSLSIYVCIYMMSLLWSLALTQTHGMEGRSKMAAFPVSRDARFTPAPQNSR